MLENLSREVVREGYDLLFSLWLANVSDSDFQQELVSVAVNNPYLIPEFEDRINGLVIRENTTDLYLRMSLRKLASEAAKYKLDNLGRNGIEQISRRSNRIFIVYSHKDEAFKDELIVMLAGLQRQGIIDIWQDRRIEAGNEWYEEIQKAIIDCDIAFLLISPDFIASPFIQDKELTRLFERRIKEGLRVIPIIVRSCLWKNEPVMKDLQVLPKDGKPVISFSKETGARDEVWMTIGKAIENLARES